MILHHREGDVIGSEGASSQYARQESQAKGQRTSAGRSSSACHASEEERAQGGWYPVSLHSHVATRTGLTGCISSHRTRFKTKQKGMDYNADIPFEKAPAPGFYDTTDESSKKTFTPVGRNLKDLEGGKRKKEMEDADRRKRQKQAKETKANGGAMANFVPAKDQQIQRLKEEQQIGKRKKLVLPGAQVGERELEEIVKIGQAGEEARRIAEEGSNEAGRGLLGDYSALAHAKDTRTPRTAPQGKRAAS